jgi:hypothetical protein
MSFFLARPACIVCHALEMARVILLVVSGAFGAAVIELVTTPRIPSSR